MMMRLLKLSLLFFIAAILHTAYSRHLKTSKLPNRIMTIGLFTPGGYQFGSSLYNSNTNKWDTHTNNVPPLFQLGAAGAQLGSVIYVTGGGYISKTNVTVITVNSVSALDMSSKKPSWITKASMIHRRRHHAVCAMADKFIYAIGGYGDNSKVLAQNERYNPIEDKWDTIASLPQGGRASLAVVALEDNMYAIGGYGETSPVKLITKYNPREDTWEKMADMSMPRAAVSATVMNGKIYVAGGIIDLDSTVTPTCEVYDPAKNGWTSFASIPTEYYRNFNGISALDDGTIYGISVLYNWFTASSRCYSYSV